MITEQHIEEGLSRACVQAISAKAGFILSNKDFDYGIDGTFDEVSTIKKRRCASGYSIDFQLKSSINWREDENSIIYSLESKTYNDLVRMRQSNAKPCILILLTLSNDRDKWLRCLKSELIIGAGCYWYCPEGHETSNKYTITIHIPKSKAFSPEVLKDLFGKYRSGESF